MLEEIGLEEGGGLGIEKWACAHPPKCNNKNNNDDERDTNQVGTRSGTSKLEVLGLNKLCRLTTSNKSQ